ncbi:DUF3105 domain-containing protein [Nocardioides sp.]|uniref:DUF3105 domain-containing protein n=1 Tax=Nocardioides sp. TaxID=35761 RepID=UPI003D0D6B84
MNGDLFEFGPSPEQRRRTAQIVFAVLTAMTVVGLTVAVPLAVEQDRDDAHVAGAATLDEVKVFSNIPRYHTEGKVDYGQVPPVGGPHNPVWLACGSFDAPVPDENAVHDLEHGTVWITYRPGLSPLQVDALTRMLPDDGIISPYEGLPAPVVVTVWGRQLALTGADDPRLPLFLEEFGGGQTAPEPLATCGGGLSEDDLTLAV